MEFGGSGDGYDPWLLREEPRKSNLGPRHALLIRKMAKHVNQSLVGFQIFFIEPWHDLAEVLIVKFCILFDGTSEKAFAQRAEGNKANSQLFKRRQDLLLRFAPP